MDHLKSGPIRAAVDGSQIHSIGVERFVLDLARTVEDGDDLVPLPVDHLKNGLISRIVVALFLVRRRLEATIEHLETGLQDPPHLPAELGRLQLSSFAGSKQ